VRLQMPGRTRAWHLRETQKIQNMVNDGGAETEPKNPVNWLPYEAQVNGTNCYKSLIAFSRLS
jgi:hypothetical protein